MFCVDCFIGLDLILIRFIKLVVKVLVSLFINIINNLILKLIFFSVWKVGCVSLIFKIDNLIDESYFRLILIFLVLLKVFEKFVV